MPQVTYSSMSCYSFGIYYPYGCSFSVPTIGSSVCINAETTMDGQVARPYDGPILTDSALGRTSVAWAFVSLDAALNDTTEEDGFLVAG